MKTQNIFIAHPTTTEQVNALKAFMQALKIKFVISSEKDYDNEFVQKILESRKQVTQGNVTRIEKENLNRAL
jgi:adenylate kinase family enzyme